MADGDIKDQMENWKDEHPEAEAAQAAPDAPCFTCGLNRDSDAERRVKSLLFNTAYDSLKNVGAAKIVLITDTECPPCEDASQIFDALIKEGAIEVLPYSKCDPRDKECIAAQGITAVPVLASRDADGNITKFFPLAGPKTSVPFRETVPTGGAEDA